jgi:hypothetical protein
MAPIAVVNTVFSAGDANRGVQTAAFNLPNDERVIREKGSKRVMLKNNQQAKFDTVLVPISKVALAPADQAHVSFEAFFTHILMHERYGMDRDISVNGKMTTVRQRLKDHSAIERRRPISACCAAALVDEASSIRPSSGRCSPRSGLGISLAFGVNEAHGRGRPSS